MRIGIDAHSVGQHRSGDESYTLGLVRGLSRIDPHNHYTLYVTSDVAHASFGDLPENFVVRRIRPHQRHARILFTYPYVLDRDRQDVVHFQYIAPPFLGAALVLTVHDVSFRVFPGYFVPMERYGLRWGVFDGLRRAARVITVSEFSKQEILGYYGIGAEKVSVTHDAVGEGFSPPDGSGSESDACRRMGIDGDFILSVGNLIRRKRPEVVVDAFIAYVSQRDTGCDLVVAGTKGEMYPALRKSVQRAGLESRVHFLGYVGEQDLLHLYRRASVFVFPSEYEGFGIPVLEAMSCGTPVVCTRETAVSEVAGDAALALDRPTDVTLAAGIRRVLQEPELRQTLIKRGSERVKLFTWDETARRTLRAYREAWEENERG